MHIISRSQKEAKKKSKGYNSKKIFRRQVHPMDADFLPIYKPSDERDDPQSLFNNINIRGPRTSNISTSYTKNFVKIKNHIRQ